MASGGFPSGWLPPVWVFQFFAFVLSKMPAKKAHNIPQEVLNRMRVLQETKGWGPKKLGQQFGGLYSIAQIKRASARGWTCCARGRPKGAVADRYKGVSEADLEGLWKLTKEHPHMAKRPLWNLAVARGHWFSYRTFLTLTEGLGLRRQKVLKRPLMNAGSRLAREKFVQHIYASGPEQYHSVMFSDEAYFSMTQWCGGKYIWASELRDRVIPLAQSGPKLMVWGIASSVRGGVYFKVFAPEERQDQAGYVALMADVLPYIRDLPEVIFQQDNATAHHSKELNDLLEGSGFRGRTLSWPACSPDYSPIERVWRSMGWELTKKKVSSLGDLGQVLTDLWWDLSTPELMASHTEACLENMLRSAGEEFSNTYRMA